MIAATLLLRAHLPDAVEDFSSLIALADLEWVPLPPSCRRSSPYPYDRQAASLLRRAGHGA